MTNIRRNFILGASTLSVNPAWGATKHIGRIIPLYVGSIGPNNAVRVLSVLCGEIDKVFGLKLNIEIASGRSPEFLKTHYSAEVYGKQFGVSQDSEGPDGGYEMVCPAAYVEMNHGSYLIDGFFVAKSGGLHQGTVSFGLEKTNEGNIRANPALKIKTIRLT